MLWKTENFSTSGQDFVYRLQMRLRFLSYCIYCSFQKYKRQVVTLLTYYVGHTLRYWLSQQIIGLKIKKMLNTKKQTETING